MENPKWTDDEILTAVRGSEESRRQALRHFFTEKALLAMVVSYVASQGGNEQDGEDVYQDAAILFDRNLREGRFEGRSSLRTYFMAIAKWHWVSKRRKYNGHLELSYAPEDATNENPETHVIEGERRELIDGVLAQLGRKCEKLLKLYMLRHSMDEIAEALGMSSGGQAKKDAYKCRVKMRAYLEQNPHLKDQLKPI